MANKGYISKEMAIDFQEKINFAITNASLTVSQIASFCDWTRYRVNTILTMDRNKSRMTVSDYLTICSAVEKMCHVEINKMTNCSTIEFSDLSLSDRKRFAKLDESETIAHELALAYAYWFLNKK